ncbi:MAG: flavin prenyltransferase UbiX [Gammaproteobacteria bacterium]
MNKQAIAVAITGASGAVYALQLLRQLVLAKKHIYLMVSKPGQVVVGMETDLVLPGRSADIRKILSEYSGAAEGQIDVFGQEEWTAPIASGTSVPEAMVVCPCTTGTLSNIANGASSNLIDRAADVVIKEGKKLLLVPREMPFSAIHLENMLKLARLGVVIMPPSPGFYHQPKSIDDLVDFVVGRILDQLHIENTLSPRWGRRL